MNLTTKLFVVAILLGTTLSVCTGMQEANKPQLDDEQRALMTKRIGVLRQLVEAESDVLENEGQGRMRVTELYSATDRLLEAELELAKTNDDRVRLLMLAVKNAKEMEAWLKLRSDIRMPLVLRAAARTLRFQIALEKAKKPAK